MYPPMTAARARFRETALAMGRAASSSPLLVSLSGPVSGSGRSASMGRASSFAVGVVGIIVSVDVVVIRPKRTG
jgi:hypothetical protein